MRQCGTPSASVILPRAPRVPVPTGNHGEPRGTTVRLSLTVRQNASLLTDGCRPLLCKAVLRRHRAQPRVPGKAKLIYQVVRLVPMLFGMNASGSRFSNSCRDSKTLPRNMTGDRRSTGNGNAEFQDRPGIGELLNRRSRRGRHQTISVGEDVGLPAVWAQCQRPVAVRGLEVLGDITLN